ncbi:MAG: AzlC family ABC transporter permease [Anaerolineales bacterium]
MTSAARQQPSAKSEFTLGVRDQAPILLAVIPFGLIFGALAISEGLSPAAAQGFSLFVFAGSAQFIAVTLIGDGAPVAVTILTIAVVNLRHALYSAATAPYLARLRQRWRWPLSWLLTDEAFATSSIHFKEHANPAGHWYLLGNGLALWASWQVSTAVGIALGSTIPSSWNLDFTLPLTFIALLIPVLRDRPSWAAALTAGLVAVALAPLPYKLGLLSGAAAGIVIGLVMDKASSEEVENAA